MAFFFFLASFTSGIDFHKANNWKTLPDFVLSNLLRKFLEILVIATFLLNFAIISFICTV